MMSNEPEENILVTCASGTSTPTFISDPAPLQLQDKDEFLLFHDDSSLYRDLREEADDDQLHWYPMRITYARRKRAYDVNNELRNKGYETYLYVQEPPINDSGRMMINENAPVYGLVFVHAMKIQLKLLKRYDPTCHIMQFMGVRPRDVTQSTRIIWVPDRQMENFISAATCLDPLSQRIPLTYTDFIDKQDRRVRILSGPFAGIEGEVKRIQRNRIVVALIREAKVALGITHIAPENLILLDD